MISNIDNNLFPINFIIEFGNASSSINLFNTLKEIEDFLKKRKNLTFFFFLKKKQVLNKIKLIFTL